MYKKELLIKSEIKRKGNLLGEYLSIELLRELAVWRTKRNSIAHDALNLDYEMVNLKEIALEGERLVNLITNKASTYRRKKK
jgi:hypothetical protein